jgi:hypothetical protein
MPMSMNQAGRLTPLKDWSFGGVEKECSRAHAANKYIEA